MVLPNVGSAMVLREVLVEVRKDVNAADFRELKVLVNPEAIHSIIPRRILKKLGVRSFKRSCYPLENGTAVVRDVGTAHFTYEYQEGGAPVVFGESKDQPTLGATALASLGVALNPVSGKLEIKLFEAVGLSKTTGLQGRVAPEHIPHRNE